MTYCSTSSRTLGFEGRVSSRAGSTVLSDAIYSSHPHLWSRVASSIHLLALWSWLSRLVLRNSTWSRNHRVHIRYFHYSCNWTNLTKGEPRASWNSFNWISNLFVCHYPTKGTYCWHTGRVKFSRYLFENDLDYSCDSFLNLSNTVFRF